jgi:hypothetical protein
VIGTVLLNVVARVALRTRTPLEAKRVVDAIGRRLPPLSTQKARRADQRLVRWGTCLSRSMAIASRLPGAEVVIGVDLAPGSGLAAHAWVERGGEVVSATHGTLREIARLR